MMAAVVDVDDVSGCPVAEVCAACGDVEGLAVGVLSTPMGVCCRTLCGPCTLAGFAGRLTSMPAAAAVLAVLDHCEHLDCTPDEMRAALDAEADQ